MISARKILSAIAAMFTTGHEVHAAEVWAGGLRAGFDFFELFHSNASWPAAAARVRVIQVSTPFIMESSEEELGETFAGHTSRGMGLVVETGVPYGAGLGGTHCGLGMEGSVGRNTAQAFARRIAKFGGGR